MITLQMEFQKIKRKKIALTMGALICVQFAWLLWSGSHPTRASGWKDGFPCSILSRW